MKITVPMRAALNDPDIFGTVLAGDSWAAWLVLLIAIAGEELTPAERVIFTALTGREREPGEPIEEAWCVCGRRSGKTRAAAVLAAWLAAFHDYSDVLAPGERATLPILSASVWQAGKALQYLDGIFTTVPALAALVEGRTNDSISLSTRVDLECVAANFRTIRGATCVAVVSDELAYWRSEATANPDVEILNAIRPSLATTGGPLICISSPYAKRGELWNAFKRDFGKDGDPAILVVKAASRDMNPGLSEKVVARAYARDAAAAAAEYGAEFRSDIENFLSVDVVDGAVEPGRYELPPLSSIAYHAFTDPSGGSADSFSLGVAHIEGETVILDLIREIQPPFSPDSVVTDFCDTLKRYHLNEVTGDRWGGEFVREQFESRGITYNVSELPKSDIYKEFLPLINSGRVELLDKPRLTSQLVGLERRTARGGRDSIDHSPGNHDDVANAAAGAIVLAAGLSNPDEFYLDEYLRAFGPESTSAQQLLGRVF